ncbi:hypothetical protein N2W52_002111 [Clostridium perfringens]|nr:hypothetical protein [Clostridium perfringens]MDK0982895.1 hypothetical protein [Clostridium perfringens]
MENARPILRLDSIKGDSHVLSIKAHKDLDNGNFVALGDLNPLEGELFTATDVSQESDIVCLISQARLNPRDDFETMNAENYTKKDEVSRGYVLSVADMFTLTDNGIEGSVTKGAYVCPEGVKLTVKEKTECKGTVLLKVLQKTKLAGYDASLLQVVRA